MLTHVCTRMCICVHTHIQKQYRDFLCCSAPAAPPLPAQSGLGKHSSKGKAQEGTASPEPHEKWKVWLSETTAASQAPSSCRMHAGCVLELQAELEPQRFMGAMTGSGW